MIQIALLMGSLLQLCLASLALAAPIADESLSTTAGGNAWTYGTGGGILGLVVLVLDIIVFSMHPQCQASVISY